MKPKKLTINNFGPFGENQVIDFDLYDDQEVVMVLGENRDEPGMDSNGAGKTSIFDCICWVLLGETPDLENVEDIIKHGAKQTECTLLSENGKDLIEITRSRRRKKNSTKEDIKVSINGEDKTKRTNGQTQEYLIRLFGFDSNNKSKEYLENFTNTTYFPVDLTKGITSSKTTSTEKFNLISRYLRLQTIDKVKALVRSMHNVNRSRLENTVAEIGDAKEELEELGDPSKILEVIETTKEDIEKRDDKISKLSQVVAKLKSTNNLFEKLDKLNEDQVSLENKVKRFENKLTNIKSLISKTEPKIDKLKGQIEKLEEEELEEIDTEVIKKQREHLSKGENKKTTLQNKAKNLKDQLDSSLTCPSCQESLMLVDNKYNQYVLELFDKESIEETYNKLSKKIEDISSKIKLLKGKIDQREEQGRKQNELLQKIRQLKSDLKSNKELLELHNNNAKEHQGYLKETQDKLDALLEEKKDIEEKLSGEDNRDKISQKEQEIKDLKSKNEGLFVKIGGLKENLKESERLLKTIKDKEEVIESIREENKPIEFWLDNLGEMKRWIIESFLPELEDLTNQYLSDIETGYIVKFNTTREKKSSEGELKEEFNITIIDSSNQERPINRFSKGESYRIAICTGFALRQLTLNQGSNSFNFILIDEIVDGIDKTGVMEFINLLNKIQGLKLIISHNPEVGDNFSNYIKAIKSNGTSIIKQS